MDSVLRHREVGRAKDLSASPRVYTISFNIQQLYVLPTQLYLYVLCGYQNKQRLFPYTTLTDWFL